MENTLNGNMKRLINKIKLWYNLKFRCTEEDKENARLRILMNKYTYEEISPEEVINGEERLVL